MYLQQSQPVLDAALFLLHPEEYGSEYNGAADVAAQASHGCCLITSDLAPTAAQQQPKLPARMKQHKRYLVEF